MSQKVYPDFAAEQALKANDNPAAFLIIEDKDKDKKQIWNGISFYSG